jgi:hypothetical protein
MSISINNIEEFRGELIELINRRNLEGVEDGNVPDRIMADVMISAMVSFNMNHKAVCDWYGVVLVPGGSKFVEYDEDCDEKEG